MKVNYPLQGGLAGLAAMFPPTYMNAMLQGQALGGIFAAATNVLIILLGDEPKDSAFFCFLVTIMFMLMTGCSLLILTLTKFFRVRIVIGNVVKCKKSQNMFLLHFSTTISV